MFELMSKPLPYEIATPQAAGDLWRSAAAELGLAFEDSPFRISGAMGPCTVNAGREYRDMSDGPARVDWFVAVRYRPIVTGFTVDRRTKVASRLGRNRIPLTDPHLDRLVTVRWEHTWDGKPDIDEIRLFLSTPVCLQAIRDLYSIAANTEIVHVSNHTGRIRMREEGEIGASRDLVVLIGRAVDAASTFAVPVN